MNITIDIGSHVHTERHWEDGFLVDHLTWFAVATDDVGHRWLHRHAFDNEHEAANLVERIAAKGNVINLDHWVEDAPAYGSQAYIEFEHNEIAPHAYALSQGWEQEEDLPDNIRAYF